MMYFTAGIKNIWGWVRCKREKGLSGSYVSKHIPGDTTTIRETKRQR